MTNENIRIYHNPRCSKSRSALAILEEKGIAPEVIDYLKVPPSKIELRNILKKLDMKPEEIVRKSEDVYKNLFQGKVLSDDEWLDALVENPILIERPIVQVAERAVIGRPPERVLELL